MVLVAYEFSSGPIAYIHCTEVASDAGLGLSIFSLNFTIVLLNLASDPLMADKNFGVIGVFSVLGILSFTGSAFMYFFMRSTEGLSDLEKKTLYMPEEIRQQKIQEA